MRAVQQMVRLIIEALQNVDVIIEEWIETAKNLGRPIPEPKGRLMFA